ncbi:unnamed protein product [Didymodactylos carnosus]|uniref:Uncharacterized protein n=1 Tax=Didymodactylos carnosus TaxID=1234261 RepID=A0A8S2EUR2_9BILA|nr:unnamed protein product [Didymodactylos carnosus]CAF4125590.1 unnamed protein product [Didymodactylos carnosus]
MDIIHQKTSLSQNGNINNAYSITSYDNDRQLRDKENANPPEVVVMNRSLWRRFRDLFKSYRWRMRHYFYIHVLIFIVFGFLGGMIIYFVELNNELMVVRYVDAWFVCCTCVYNCGLTTIDFARLSRASQIFRMFVTLCSGITITTLPALIIKTRTHKSTVGIKVDDDYEDDDDNGLPTTNLNRDTATKRKLKSLLTADQLRYRAYMTTIFLILTTCFTIYGITFVVIGAWIQNKYQPNQLLQDGRVISGWFASFIITVTGFNQNGLAPWSDSLARFAEDVSFPTVQTRIYLLITSLLYITGVSISLILDLNNNNFAQYSGDKQFLIFLFHTGMTRFAGFTTIDISSLAAGTLIVYLLLMAVKPQMLCSMDETPFELEWVALKTQEEVNKKIKPLRHVDQEEEIHVERDRRSSLDLAFPIRQMNRFLRRQSLQVKLMAKDHYSTEAKNRSNTRENDKISMTKKHDVRREPPVDIAWIRLRLFFVFFSRKIITYTFDFLIGTLRWMKISPYSKLYLKSSVHLGRVDSR